MKIEKLQGKLPKVSIVIACYNDPFVKRAVEMACAQDYPNKEIIVVNDGSNKLTSGIIEELQDKIDLVLHQSNQGQSIARNKGISQSAGDYILNWDSDDYFEPTFSSKAVNRMSLDSKIKIITCYSRRFYKNETIDIFKPIGGSLKNFLFTNSAMGSSMFRKEDWKKVGGYEEEAPVLGFEDWEFYIKLLRSGGYAEVIPEVLFHYCKRSDSTTEKIKEEKAEKFRQIIHLHKDIYLSNFDELVDYLINRLQRAENESLRRTTSVDYKLGSAILKPIRFFKSRF